MNGILTELTQCFSHRSERNAELRSGLPEDLVVARRTKL